MSVSLQYLDVLAFLDRSNIGFVILKVVRLVAYLLKGV